jgi:hypothetical protein
MDMSGMSTTMSMDMGTATTSAAMPTATDQDMGSMGGMGGMGDGCKISVSMMLSFAHIPTDMIAQDAVELEHYRLM